jgi:hypothetical protein
MEYLPRSFAWKKRDSVDKFLTTGFIMNIFSWTPDYNFLAPFGNFQIILRYSKKFKKGL